MFGDEKKMLSRSNDCRVDRYMTDGCHALGYKMDCCDAFSETYGKAVNDYEEPDKISDDMNDIDLLGYKCKVFELDYPAKISEKGNLSLHQGDIPLNHC